MLRYLYTVLFFFFSLFVGAYEISGKLNLSDDWQPRVYLASINAPENLFVASPEFIINEALIDADGQFLLTGNDLPEEPRFYRIYIVRNNLFAVEFITGSVRNFAHLLLNNSSIIKIESSDNKSVFDSLVIRGSKINSKISQFEKSYFEKQKHLTSINTIAKRDFQSQSLNRYIRSFVDSCESSLVALFAIYHIVDPKTDFLRNSQFYFHFQDRLKLAFPSHIYTYAYDDMLINLVGYRDLVCEIPRITKTWRDWIIAGEGLVILFLVLWIFRIRRPFNKKKVVDYRSLLTDKEFKIWERLASGKSNKEIASELFIELSTVKTHINSLYRRLNVANRKEAIKLYSDWQN
ncbi:LuxR C-terminal-related transcriptional regulator [uncultured Sunxiuqinia sp.]|uniref:response regulator transcription factor n=1 Tax=uncultured Sunxiuqinia sp. TaxID=1573825 RepID=UPI002AA74819|nr:LuxR C-terminal-related transcriptional regulator [uncultured Sunxiuqinia sp.]